MFTRETSIILGAGGSFHYGYPTGTGLIDDICDIIKNQKIYVPHYSGDTPNLEDLTFLFNFFQHLPTSEIFNLNIVTTMFTGDENFIEIKHDRVSSGRPILGRLVNIKDIKPFNKLYTTILNDPPINIDKFLKDNEDDKDIQIAGKLIICYILLTCESQNSFHKNYSRKLKGKPLSPDNWYTSLKHDLTSGLGRAEFILRNRINIITFNYDMSLDAYINRFIYQHPKWKTVFDENDPIVNIQHVYGMLHPLEDHPNQYYNYGFADELENCYESAGNIADINALRNMATLVHAYRIKDNIKTIGEDKQRDAESMDYHDIIQQSNDVYIIGFGANENNLRLLGLQDALRGGNHKTVYYHNYNGENQWVERELRKLDRSVNPNIVSKVENVIVSKRNRIEDAWQKDFGKRFPSGKPISTTQNRDESQSHEEKATTED